MWSVQSKWGSCVYVHAQQYLYPLHFLMSPDSISPLALVPGNPDVLSGTACYFTFSKILPIWNCTVHAEHTVLNSPLCVPVTFPFYYWAVCYYRRDHISFILFTCPPHDECVQLWEPNGGFFILSCVPLTPLILSPASLSETTGCSRVILNFPHRTLESATSLGSSALFCHFLRLSCLSPPD